MHRGKATVKLKGLCGRRRFRLKRLTNKQTHHQKMLEQTMYTNLICKMLHCSLVYCSYDPRIHFPEQAPEPASVCVYLCSAHVTQREKVKPEMHRLATLVAGQVGQSRR